MPSYLVQWEIDIDAENPKEAAEKAQWFQRAPDTMATVFDVTDENGNTVRVDLLNKEEDDNRCRVCGEFPARSDNGLCAACSQQPDMGEPDRV